MKVTKYKWRVCILCKKKFNKKYEDSVSANFVCSDYCSFGVRLILAANRDDEALLDLVKIFEDEKKILKLRGFYDGCGNRI